jgi:hypothetical protein
MVGRRRRRVASSGLVDVVGQAVGNGGVVEVIRLDAWIDEQLAPIGSK